jgi:hypothetical protein
MWSGKARPRYRIFIAKYKVLLLFIYHNLSINKNLILLLSIIVNTSIVK